MEQYHHEGVQSQVVEESVATAAAAADSAAVESTTSRTTGTTTMTADRQVHPEEAVKEYEPMTTTATTTTTTRKPKEGMEDDNDDNNKSSSSKRTATANSSSPSLTERRRNYDRFAATCATVPTNALPESPFVTTTSVLKHLNKALADMGQAQINQQQQQQEEGNQSAGERAQGVGEVGGFELQKRLPDGSSRKATETEQAAADAQTKIQQVAAHVALLKTPAERLAFAESQRVIGNAYFAAGNFKEAIDVYLTSLLAIQPQLPVTTMEAKRKQQQSKTGCQIIPLPTTDNDQDDQDGDQDDESAEPFPLPQQTIPPPTTSTTTTSNAATPTPVVDPKKSSTTPLLSPEDQRTHLVLFFKTMNNLALSALNLGWYHKTEQFCTIALEQVEHNDDDQSNPPLNWFPQPAEASSPSKETNQALERLQQVAKLYYKRAKSRRLRGLYKQARSDLNTANQWIDQQQQLCVSLLQWRQQQQQQPENESFVEEDTCATAVQEQRRAVQKEEQLLTQALAEGKRNKERAQRAMQRILNPSGNNDKNQNTNTDALEKKCIIDDPNSAEMKNMLSDEMNTHIASASRTAISLASSSRAGNVKMSTDDTTLYPEASQPKLRGYSTLRAPKISAANPPPALSEPFQQVFRKQKQTSHNCYDDLEREEQVQRLAVEAWYGTSLVSKTKFYWRMYLVVVGRVAQQVLDWIGDNDDEGGESAAGQRQEQQQQQEGQNGNLVGTDLVVRDEGQETEEETSTRNLSSRRVHFKDD